MSPVPKKSAALHRAQGTSRSRNQHDNSAGFAPVTRLRVPESLNQIGKAAFCTLGKLLIEKQLLQEPDVFLLTCLCEHWSHLVEAQTILRRDGLLVEERAETRSGLYVKRRPNAALTVIKEASSRIESISRKFALNPAARQSLAATLEDTQAKIAEAQQPDDADDLGIYADEDTDF